MQAIKVQDLVDIVNRHIDHDGSFDTEIPSLFITRLSQTNEAKHGVYKTSLCVIVQGEKETVVDTHRFIYGPENYLVASVHLPALAQVTKASQDKPYLALQIELDNDEILNVLRNYNKATDKRNNPKFGMYVGALNHHLLDALRRYLSLLDSPKDIPFLAPLIKEEIIYRLLESEEGDQLRQLVVKNSTTLKIDTVIKYIMRHFTSEIDIDILMDQANMSASSLHRHFKEVTSMSPIQYQKQLRLQKARSLLLSDSDNVADIAFEVGYGSATQFNREYSRMFGRPPKQDVLYLKNKL